MANRHFLLNRYHNDLESVNIDTNTIVEADMEDEGLDLLRDLIETKSYNERKIIKRHMESDANQQMADMKILAQSNVDKKILGSTNHGLLMQTKYPTNNALASIDDYDEQTEIQEEYINRFHSNR